MSEKAWKMLLIISDNVMLVGLHEVELKVSILLVLFTQGFNKYIRMNGSINL